MDFTEFCRSLSQDESPPDFDFALTGLWWDAKNNWKLAHEAAQQDEGPDGSWVHAYLHRKEGDASNAAYWYSRAGKQPAQTPLEEEWLQIVKSLLNAREHV
jgi:hypothetical protein